MRDRIGNSPMASSKFFYGTGGAPARTGATPASGKIRMLSLAVSLLAALLGASCIVWAVYAPRFRDAEGFLNGRFCLALASGAALFIISGTFVKRRWLAFGGWFALALVGQALALQMIDAGPLIHYQHYKPVSRLLAGKEALLLLGLATQTVLVGIGIRNHWSGIYAWTKRNFRIWQLVGIGLTLFLSGAAVSREIYVYLGDLFFAAFVQALNLANIVLIIFSLPEAALALLKRGFDKFLWAGGKERASEPEGVDRFAVTGAVCVAVFAAVLSFYVYEKHPHVPDEVQYLFQARYLAHGQLSVPAPSVPDAFSIYMIPTESPRWYSIFSPGWPAALALGVFFGAPWLVNPMLAGLNILLAYIFLRELYARRTARIALLLLCVSPWQIFMAMNFMSHTFALTCALAAGVAMARASRTHKIGWALGAGFGVGLLSLVRPLDGLAAAGLLGLWAISAGGWKRRLRLSAAFGFGLVLVGALALPYNKFLTGHPTLAPLDAYYTKYFGPQAMALGFGPGRGMGWGLDAFPGHSPLEAVINADLNIFSLNTELFGWSAGSLFIISGLLFSGKLERGDHLMLFVIAVIVAVYSLFWYSGGPDFGARYWYLALVPLVALTARGIVALEKSFATGNFRHRDRDARALVLVAALCVISLVTYIPWRAIDKYHHYLNMRPDVASLAREYGFGNSIVLIRGNEHPDYQSAWVYNPLNANAHAPVYAWDKSAAIRAQVLAAYADRTVWIVEGPSITHSGYKVARGPLSARELLKEENREPRVH